MAGSPVISFRVPAGAHEALIKLANPGETCSQTAQRLLLELLGSPPLRKPKEPKEPAPVGSLESQLTPLREEIQAQLKKLEARLATLEQAIALQKHASEEQLKPAIQEASEPATAGETEIVPPPPLSPELPGLSDLPDLSEIRRQTLTDLKLSPCGVIAEILEDFERAITSHYSVLSSATRPADLSKIRKQLLEKLKQEQEVGSQAIICRMATQALKAFEKKLATIGLSPDFGLIQVQENPEKTRRSPNLAETGSLPLKTDN